MIRSINEFKQYGTENSPSNNEFILSNGDTVKITYFNNPRHVSESPNNISFDYLRNNNLLFALMRIGEQTLLDICNNEIVEDKDGDLSIIFNTNTIEVYNNDDNSLIVKIDNKSKIDLAYFIGLHIGYSFPDVENMYKVNEKKKRDKINQTGIAKSKEFKKKLKDKKLPGGFSQGKDKDGFYIYTHRTRSKSYKTQEGIPIKVIKFIDSTG